MSFENLTFKFDGTIGKYPIITNGVNNSIQGAGCSSGTGFNSNEQFIFVENKASFADMTSGYTFI
ncbi:MAG: hypothetical protein QNJ32_13130 [Xenococcaceae cyanobacterium MO_167.B27]|nr:hypothetical protein [Xenococcaceae cyanobacterium MO_167.B27]